LFVVIVGSVPFLVGVHGFRGSGFMVQGSEVQRFKVQGSGFKVQGSGFKVQGL